MTVGPRLHDALACAYASRVDSAGAPVPSSTALAVRTGMTI